MGIHRPEPAACEEQVAGSLPHIFFARSAMRKIAAKRLLFSEKQYIMKADGRKQSAMYIEEGENT